MAFGRFSDLARAIATSLMSMTTTDRALLKIAWLKWPSPQPSSRTDLSRMNGFRHRRQTLSVCGAYARSRALRDFPLRQRLLLFHPFAPSRFESVKVFQRRGLWV